MRLVEQAAGANNSRAVGGYDAYFGRYRIDDASGITHHTLDAALSAENVGHTFERRLDVQGDRLTIELATTAPDGAKLTRTLTWERVG